MGVIRGSPPQWCRYRVGGTRPAGVKRGMEQTSEGSYRPAVGIFLFNADGLAFIGHRWGLKKAWQLPQGGIDTGELPLEAAMRELFEETGITRNLVTPVAEMNNWLRYDIPPHKRRKNSALVGQEQKWFALFFIGRDQDVDIGATESPEFDAWRWEKPEVLPGLAVWFKRRVYQEVVRQFAPLAREFTVC